MLQKRQSTRPLDVGRLLISLCQAGLCIWRRISAIAIVVMTVLLSPQSSQADFVAALGEVSGTGQGASTEHGQAPLQSVAVQTDAASMTAPTLDIAWGLFGWGSTSHSREPAPTEKPPVDENHRSSEVHSVADLGNSGAGSTSSTVPPGGSGACVGILNGSLAPWLSECSGTAPCHKVLAPPSPPPSSLLDPPKDSVDSRTGMSCC